MQPFKRREDKEQGEDARRGADRSGEQETSEDQGETDRPEDGEQMNNTASEQGSQQQGSQQEDLQAHSETGRIPEWNPSIDVFTKGEDFVIRAALPGIKREEVKITLSGGILTFAGEGQAEDSSSGYRVREIQRGPFNRSVSLPADRDSDKVKAALENGVLEITVQGGAAVTNEVRIGG